MATISTSQDWDSASRTAGEAVTIQNGATLTINTDTRYHKNSPASGTGTLGTITMTSATGGELLIDGRNVRWLPYTSGSGNAPAYDTNIVGNTSGATGKLLGVYSAVNSAPVAVGSAIPASGFIKLKSASASYNASETLTGISATTNGIDVTGWIEVVCDDAIAINVGRAQTFRVRGDWFYLDDTTGSAQTFQLPTCGGGTGTMYPGIWVETGVGTDEYEFWPAQKYAASLASGWYSTAKGTDERSKFCEMRDGGVIRIGANDSGAYGYIPPAGCKVRIPNVLLNGAATASRASNNINSTIASRPEFAVTNAGNIDMDGFLSTWYFNINQPYSCVLKNGATMDTLIVTECASAIELEEMHNGNWLNSDLNALTLTSNLAGGTITKCKFGRTGARGSSDYGVYVSYSKDITFTDCHFQGRIFRTNAGAHCLGVIYSYNIKLIRPILVGGSCYISASSNCYVEEPVYADSYHSISLATASPVGVVYFSTGTFDCVLKGGSFWAGIDNMHIDTAYFYTANTTRARWYNCGTPASPINGGSSNAMLYAYNDGGNNIDVELKRIYFTSLGTRFANGTNSSKGFVFENCSGNYGTHTTFDDMDVLTKGLAVSAMDTAYTSVYGTIFYNIFTSATVGRVGLVFNEDTSTYASYVNKTGLTGASGFSSTGLLYLYNLNDVIEYEFPYYVKGYTAFAASNVVLAGSGTANLGVKYQIDVNDGNGWNGTWKDATSANLSAETIDETDGFKLKIQITCTTAGTNYLNTLYFTMVTDSTAQNELYPLDEYTLTLTGLQTGTKVAILEAGTENLLELLTESGGEVSYTYPDTDVTDEIDIAILAAGYLYQKIEGYELTDDDASIPVSQNVDYGYDSGTSATVTFNGTTKRIVCDSGTTSINVVGVYTEWVDWALTSDNLKYKNAFNELGGNTIDSGAGTSVPVYGFLVNDWRISPDEADHTLAVTGGIILVDGGGDPFVDTAGDYTVRINYQQPVQAITVSTGGGSSITAADVWSYATRKLSSAGIAEVQSGLATSAEINALNDISPAEVNAEVNQALADYDPPTRDEATSDKNEIIAAVPTVSENQEGLLTEDNFLALR